MLWRWLTAFFITQLVEVPIYSRGFPCPLLVAFGASAVTHPIVWFGFFGPYGPTSYLTRLISAELFAWLVEAAYFRFLFRKKKALLLSFAANSASLAVGFLAQSVFGSL